MPALQQPGTAPPHQPPPQNLGATLTNDDQAAFVSHFLPLATYVLIFQTWFHFGGHHPLQNPCLDKVKMMAVMLILRPTEEALALNHD